MRTAGPRAPDPHRADGFWNDSWDGYPAARKRALAAWGAKKNVLTVGGDVHASYVSDLKADFDDSASPVLATEIVGTSISSPGRSQAATERALRHNPHIKFGKSDQRGYTLLEVDDKTVTATLRVIDAAAVQEPAIGTVARFFVKSGKPGAQKLQ
jgi:alkaline phosphatase D